MSKKFKSYWNEEKVKNNPNECFELKNGVFKVGIDATANSVKKILDRCISGEYKMAISKIVNKDEKYYIHLAYSFEIDIENKSLIDDRVLGIDLGCNNPIYAAVNFNRYTRHSFGGSYIIDQKMKYERELKVAQKTAQTICKNGHGRKNIIQVPTRIKNKRSNYSIMCNRNLAKEVVDYALKNQCAQIHMEKLTGLYKKIQKDSYLGKWTYYQLQTFIEEKANEYGIKVEYVNPQKTSQTCSKCGYASPLNRPKDNRGAQYFCCIECGYKVNADFNAARNIAIAKPLNMNEEYLAV